MKRLRIISLSVIFIIFLLVVFGSIVDAENTGQTAQDWKNLGLTYLDQAKYQEALDSFNKAISLDPNDPFPWYYKSLTLTALGRNQESAESFQKGEKLNKELLNEKYGSTSSYSSSSNPQTTSSPSVSCHSGNINIKTTDLPSWVRGKEGQVQLEATTSVPLTWIQIPSETWPETFKLSQDGVIYGNPPLTTPARGQTVTVIAYDTSNSQNCAEKKLLINIRDPPPTITPHPLTLNVGQSYNALQVVDVQGGSPWTTLGDKKYTIQGDALVAGGEFPPWGMSLNPDGTLSGTPTKAGTYRMGVKVIDSNLVSVSTVVTIVVKEKDEDSLISRIPSLLTNFLGLFFPTTDQINQANSQINDRVKINQNPGETGQSSSQNSVPSSGASLISGEYIGSGEEYVTNYNSNNPILRCTFSLQANFQQSGNTVSGTIQQQLKHDAKWDQCTGIFDQTEKWSFSGTLSYVGTQKRLTSAIRGSDGSGTTWIFDVSPNSDSLSGSVTFDRPTQTQQKETCFSDSNIPCVPNPTAVYWYGSDPHSWTLTRTK